MSNFDTTCLGGHSRSNIADGEDAQDSTQNALDLSIGRPEVSVFPWQLYL